MLTQHGSEPPDTLVGWLPMSGLLASESQPCAPSTPSSPTADDGSQQLACCARLSAKHGLSHHAVARSVMQGAKARAEKVVERECGANIGFNLATAAWRSRQASTAQLGLLRSISPAMAASSPRTKGEASELITIAHLAQAHEKGQFQLPDMPC